jgi:hypothetical protein
MKQYLPILRKEAGPNGARAGQYMATGPFGLFNIDIYVYDKPLQRPFKPLFCQQKELRSNEGDYQYILGVVVNDAAPERPRSYATRVIDACWDPTDPEANLRAALDFLMDLVNAKGV